MTEQDITQLKENSFISSKDIHYDTTIKRIKKEKNPLRPIFEAFSNSWESFGNGIKDYSDKKIDIILDLNKIELQMDVPQHYGFDKITVKDNGWGFTNKDFSRFLVLDDDTKGPANKGAGRMQYLHFFNITEFDSIYNENGKNYERKFSLSKKASYLKENAIVKYEWTRLTEKNGTGTTIIFRDPIVDSAKDCYERLDPTKIAEKIIRNFILNFCTYKDHLPQINIIMNIDGAFSGKKQITKDDIPSEEKKFSMELTYKKKENGKIIDTDKKEKIEVRTIKIDADKLDRNKIILTAKNECTNTELDLQCLADKDIIDNKRYMFLLSSNYFDEKASTNRGVIELCTKEKLEKDDNELFEEDVLLEDDVVEEINYKIPEQFTEIEDKRKEIDASIEKLQRMFLLREEAIKSVKITVNDDDKSILRKIYEYDCAVMADKDARLKKQIENLETLSTTDPNYNEKLSQEVDYLVENIPFQNRTALTQYIARRQLILRQFKLILDRKLICQNKESERNEDEKLLHNLIFQQKSSDTEDSALWILNEDFIYFKGCSEERLSDITIDGNKIFKEDITEKEKEYLEEFGEHRDHLRPDIMLFPSENKAIIIEFKAPQVNVSKYLNQITNYAILLLNFTTQEYNLSTFYGYLIGENINALDIRHNDGDFKEAYNYDYLFRPAKIIANDNNGKDGSLYTEVIKYSTLLKRAETRNRIYKKKLGITDMD